MQDIYIKIRKGVKIMTKKQLVKWLEGKQQEAMCAASEQYKVAVLKHQNELYQELGLHDLAATVQNLLSQADDAMAAWNEKFKDKVQMTKGWGGVHDKLYYFVNSPDATFKRIVEHDFQDCTTELQEIKKKKGQIESEISKNYINVIANVQGMKDAKLGIEYLKELGFDLSALIEADKKPISTALAVSVDTRFLFVGGQHG